MSGLLVDADFERLLLTSQATLERVAERQALARSLVSYAIVLTPIDPETKEPLHGTQPITVAFDGPLFGAWTQRRLPLDSDAVMKASALGRSRALKASGVAVLELGSAAQGPRLYLQSRGLPAWDATELSVQSEHPHDQKLPLRVHFDPESRALLWMELTHSADALPGLCEQLRRSAVELYYQRLLQLPIVQRYKGHLGASDASPINIDT